MGKLKVIDLFVGVGGFSLGAYLAGFEPAVGIDCDETLTSSIKTNFPKTQLILNDISKLKPEKFVSKIKIKKDEITGIIGGPPCQGFSFIGKRDPNDPRNSLVLNFFEYVNYIEPAFFVMENVEGILSEEFVSYLNNGLQLIKLNYHTLEPFILNSIDFGLPSSRNRVFVIGYKPDLFGEITKETFFKEQEKIEQVFVKDALFDLPLLENAQKNGTGDFWAYYSDTDNLIELSKYAIWARKEAPKDLSNNKVKNKHANGWVSGFKPTNHSKRVIKRFSGVEPGKSDKVSKFPRLKWDDYATTLRAGTGPDRGSFQAVRPIHPEEDRVITVREAARLQSFPDWFQFHITKWHSFRMIGNSVPPLLAKNILKVFQRKFRSS